MNIEFKNVDSSNIKGYYYNPSEKLLYIKFHNDRVYFYQDVTREEYENLINAESFGKEFYKKISNKKKFEELW